MATDPIQMIWEQRWVGRPVGTHFSDVAPSVLAFKNGTNRLLTHATLGPRIDSVPGPTKLVAAFAAGVAVTAGAVTAVPRVKNWRDNRKSQRSLGATPVNGFCVAVDDALDEHQRMSSAEAERRILDVLLAAAIIAKNLRALAGARIEDGSSPELQTAMKKLTLPQLTDTFNRTLEADSGLLDDEKSAFFFELFEGGRTIDGEFLPLRNESLAEALRLPQPGS